MPRRTCVGCGRVREKEQLVRLADDNGRLVVDRRARLFGRGCYICPETECVKTAYKKRKFSRVLRAELILPTEQELVTEVTRRHAAP